MYGIVSARVSPLWKQRWYVPTSSPGNQHNSARARVLDTAQHNTKAACEGVGQGWCELCEEHRNKFFFLKQ